MAQGTLATLHGDLENGLGLLLNDRVAAIYKITHSQFKNSVSFSPFFLSVAGCRHRSDNVTNLKWTLPFIQPHYEFTTFV